MYISIVDAMEMWKFITIESLIDQHLFNPSRPVHF